MDPISATITIAGGIQTVFTFASALKTYIDNARSAREDLKRLVGTIESVFSSIQELEALLEQNRATAYWNDYGVVRARKCIEDGFFIVGKLGHVLLKSGSELDENVAENINSSIFIPFVWPIYKSQVQELNTELILLKLDIGVAHTTYRSQNWTAEEKVKGRETLQRYQQSREIFLSQLQAMKEERFALEGSDESDSDSPKDRLEQEEQRVFEEWEEAVAERLRLELRLKEEEAAVLKQREQQIRDDFVMQIKKDAADRQEELLKKRQEMEDLIKDKDIPLKDKKWIVESAIQTFHPVTHDSDLVQALLHQSDPSRALDITPGNHHNIIQKNVNQEPKRRSWSWRRLRGQSSSSSTSSGANIPILLRDAEAPGGRAVLYAAHFTPDPYGKFRSIEVEALSLWAKCAKLSKTSEELTAEFMFLPENCKSAILKLLDDLCSSSRNYTWNMLLVYHAQSKPRKIRLTSQARSGSSAGVFAIFKRHLRHHHGINTTSSEHGPNNELTTRLKQPDSTDPAKYQENPATDINYEDEQHKTSGEDLLPKQNPPFAAALQSIVPSPGTRSRGREQERTLHTNAYDDIKPRDNPEHSIRLVENDGRPMYQIALQGLRFRDFSRNPLLVCVSDPNDATHVLVLTDVPISAIFDAITEIYGRRRIEGEVGMAPQPRYTFEPTTDVILQQKATLLQHKRKEQFIRRRMMSARYNKAWEDLLKSSSESDTSEKETPINISSRQYRGYPSPTRDEERNRQRSRYYATEPSYMDTNDVRHRRDRFSYRDGEDAHRDYEAYGHRPRDYDSDGYEVPPSRHARTVPRYTDAYPYNVPVGVIPGERTRPTSEIHKYNGPSAPLYQPHRRADNVRPVRVDRPVAASRFSGDADYTRIIDEAPLERHSRARPRSRLRSRSRSRSPPDASRGHKGRYSTRVTEPEVRTRSDTRPHKGRENAEQTVVIEVARRRADEPERVVYNLEDPTDEKQSRRSRPVVGSRHGARPRHTVDNIPPGSPDPWRDEATDFLLEQWTAKPAVNVAQDARKAEAANTKPASAAKQDSHPAEQGAAKPILKPSAPSGATDTAAGTAEVHGVAFDVPMSDDAVAGGTRR